MINGNECLLRNNKSHVEYKGIWLMGCCLSGSSLLELAEIHVVNVCIDKLIWAVLQSGYIRKDFESIIFPIFESVQHVTLPRSLWNATYTAKAKSFPNTNRSFIVCEHKIENGCLVSKSRGGDKECFSHSNTSSVTSVHGRCKETTIANLNNTISTYT